MFKLKTHSQAGFTLLEALLVVAILGILFLLALPLDRKFLARNQLAVQANQLFEILQLGRATAIRFGNIVTLCPSIEGLSCSDEWTEGQILFLDKSANGQVDLGDEVIRHWGALPAGITLTWHGFSSDNRLQFEPSGIGRVMNGSFVIRYEAKQLQLQQTVVVNRSGRARLTHLDEHN